jgi:sarcosine oxidase
MTQRTTFDTIVIGCGGIGSAAVYWLSRRLGNDVLGIEQFEIGHVRGGSQDHSRIIRLVYDSDDYTRLTPYTYQAWATVEDESGQRIVNKTGGLTMSIKDGPYQHHINNYAQSMSNCDIPFERYGAQEVMHRYPQWQFDEDVDCIYQSEMGLVDAIKGNASHITLARKRGATVIDRCPVLAINPIGSGAEVVTARGTFSCRHLVVAAGGWTDKLFKSIGLNFRIISTQEQVTYYATPNIREFSMDRFPTFMWEGEIPAYGFPVYGEVATKIGLDCTGPVVDPDKRDFLPSEALEHIAESWLKRYCPGFLGPILYTKTCQYDLPRDRNFILDILPQYPQISIFVGAGHAYKFASLAGLILTELALDGKTNYDISTFSVTRPAVSDPDYPISFQHTSDWGAK